MDRSLEQQPKPTATTAPSARPIPKRPLRLRDATLQRHAGVLLIGVCVLGCVIATLFSSLAAAREQKEFQRLQQAGVTVQAEVISRTDIGHGSERLTYRLTIISPAGVPQSFTHSAIAARSGQPLSLPYQTSVVYDPADPRISRLSSDTQPPASVAWRMFPFCWLGWLPLVAGVMTVAMAHKRQESARRLEQYGLLASGVVVECWHKRGRQGGPSITYQFDAQLLNGQRRRIVKAEIVDLVTRFQHMQAGMSLQVRYLPDDPKISRIEWG
jgi:hypothetical protein